MAICPCRGLSRRLEPRKNLSSVGNVYEDQQWNGLTLHINMSINTDYSFNFTINNFLEKLTLYTFILQKILNGYFLNILNPSKNVVNNL